MNLVVGIWRAALEPTLGWSAAAVIFAVWFAMKPRS
jgi:hypothetical protein